MTNPTFPAICIDRNYQVDVIPNEEFLSQAVTSALLDPDVFADNFFYDSDLIKWTHIRTAENFKPNFIARFLARNMIFNPVVVVKITWTKNGHYELEQLKKLLQSSIEKDDDITTQFEDRDSLKEKVQQSTSIKQLIKILKSVAPGK